MVLNFKFEGKILKCYHSNKIPEQCFPVVLFIMMYKIDVTFIKSVNKILICNHCTVQTSRNLRIIRVSLNSSEIR